MLPAYAGVIRAKAQWRAGWRVLPAYAGVILTCRAEPRLPPSSATTPATTAPASPTAAGQQGAAGNRGGSRRQAVLRPVLGRPVRPLVDAARAVRAARGQPGDLGSGSPRLPFTSPPGSPTTSRTPP